MKNKILQLFMDGADRTYTEVNIRRKIYQKYKFIKHTDGTQMAFIDIYITRKDPILATWTLFWPDLT